MSSNEKPLKSSKKKKLESKGWKVESAEDFLGLSKEESEFIRVKLALARYLKVKRLERRYSQTDLAQRIKSSQSRVAKMEQGDPSVSVDLLIHSLLTLGTTRKELARVIGAFVH
jgi:DNA-binding XRE family transcriptional regulator